MDSHPITENEGESLLFGNVFVEQKDSATKTDNSSLNSTGNETCDDLINELVTRSKSSGLADGNQHKEDCPLYEEKIVYVQAQPCPPGVRPCCTCGVCPLDLIEQNGEGYGIEEWDAKLQSSRTQATYRQKIGFGMQTYGHKGWGGYGQFQGETDIDYSLMSICSGHEGSVYGDYMKLFLEPICYRSLSSISTSFVSCEEPALQRTIVIVKPDAVAFKEAIYRAIFEAGFQILGVRVLHLSPEQVSEIYSKFYGSPAFVHLVVTVSDAPVLAICISAMNVIKKWLNMIGLDGSLRGEWFYPLSMRKMFGLHDTHADWIHGSENLKASNKENRYFYPEAIIEPIITEQDKVSDYCTLNINRILVSACTEVVKKRPVDPILFVADYLLVHNPFQPRFPTEIALLPT